MPEAPGVPGRVGPAGITIGPVLFPTPCLAAIGSTLALAAVATQWVARTVGVVGVDLAKQLISMPAATSIATESFIVSPPKVTGLMLIGADKQQAYRGSLIMSCRLSSDRL